ncbi:hemicentin-1 [Phlebotomus argentipes]|uniref:hemicentin-1 n=1 Tax=Phlebotomus argentipes TaxID=94469 RepID=UPI00289363EF|nr:hemicentin-1 [Phlebotomus argentipes]
MERSSCDIWNSVRSKQNDSLWIIYTLFWIICSISHWSSSSAATSVSPIVSDENGPLSEVQTAVGLEASMPCELVPISVSMMTDKVQLVIWYKEGNIKPIYTFDARMRPLHQGIHWADELVLKSKAHFHYESNPPALRLRNVKREDAGLYRCRVDFHKSPTRNSRINLTVLVPPTHLTVLDDLGAAVADHTIGPYREQATINITCLSSGGVPPPRVSWWKEHALLDDSFQVLPDGSVKNILHLSKLNRHDLHTIYTCQATNGHVVPPLSTYVKLELKLPPLYVRLQGLNHALVAGVRTQISCSSAGARPPPEIIWNKGGLLMRGASQTTSSDGNVTVSEVVFLPAPEDNGKIVTCSVTTETISGGAGLFLKDSRILDVKHAPIVSLSLGAPLDPNKLMNGSDVYLECDIRANPPIRKIEWFHNEKQLYSMRGVIISNQTLVLQAISKASHGQYMCRSENAQGSVSSNDVYLDVKYPPICKSESTVIRAALKQTINILCDIDSNPLQNLTYKWYFNNTLDSSIELPPPAAVLPHAGDPEEHRHSPNALGAHQKTEHRRHQRFQTTARSAKSFHARSPGRTYPFRIESFANFGTVTCSAENLYGHSGLCAYHILAAELPDPVKNCTAFNATANSVQVSCLPGRDGGIPQQFHVEIIDKSTNTVLYNASYRHPDFTLKRLPIECDLIIKVLAFNLQGSSNWYRLHAKTLPAPLLRTASSTAVFVKLTPLLGALMGVAGTLILVVGCIVICMRMRRGKQQKREHRTTEAGTADVDKDKGSAEPLSRNMGSHSSIDDKNPDVVPQENSEDEFLSEEKAFERLNSDRILYNSRLNSSPPPLSPASFPKNFGELSLTTNPSFTLYSSPQRRPMYASPPLTLLARSPPNVYSRNPTRYGVYDSPTGACQAGAFGGSTVPLLNNGGAALGATLDDTSIS